MKLISCNSNKELSKAIANHLKTELICADIKRFSDNEIFVEITENVRGTTKYLKEMLTNWQKTKDAYQQKITAPDEKSYKEINQSDKVKLALASYYKGFTAVKKGNGELSASK